MPNRAATDAALNPKRGAPKRATGQQIAFLLDLLAVFNILLDCLLYIFYYLYYLLGIFAANPSVLE